MPSISSARHQYNTARVVRASHMRSSHRRKAPSKRSEAPQDGHSLGDEMGADAGNWPSKARPSACERPSRSCSLARPRPASIFGMTSPRRTMRTLSPSRRLRRSTSPALCSVVFSTVTPATTCGAMRATGVTAPVRPVCQSTASSTETASSGGNFQARAQRGW